MPPAKMPSSLGWGGSSITSRWMGSTPKARAGRESVTRFTHSSWMASRGVGAPSRKAASTTSTSPILQESRKWMVLRMFR